MDVMAQVRSVLDKVPPGAELLVIGGLLAFGTKAKTVQWIAFVLGGTRLLLGVATTTA